MPMAVARNFGNLAEMYAMVLATADLGLRPARVDHLMVSNVDANGEGWPFVDAIAADRGCSLGIFNDSSKPLPFFLHYCQRYEIESLKTEALNRAKGDAAAAAAAGADWMFSKYQVPDAILACPAKEPSNPMAQPAESSETAQPESKSKKPPKKFKMRLTSEGLLPEPPTTLRANGVKDLRNVLSHCTASRATNRAALDYRKWFCDS